MSTLTVPRSRLIALLAAGALALALGVLLVARGDGSTASALTGTTGPINVTVTPTDNLTDGQAISVTGTMSSPGFFEIRAHICKPGMDIQNSYDFGYQGYNCSKTSPGTGDHEIVQTLTGSETTASLTFKAGIGTVTWNSEFDGSEQTLTCDATHPCDLVTQFQVSGGGTYWFTAPLTYSGSGATTTTAPATTTGPGTTTTTSPGTTTTTASGTTTTTVPGTTTTAPGPTTTTTSPGTTTTTTTTPSATTTSTTGPVTTTTSTTGPVTTTTTNPSTTTTTTPTGTGTVSGDLSPGGQATATLPGFAAELERRRHAPLRSRVARVDHDRRGRGWRPCRSRSPPI